MNFTGQGNQFEDKPDAELEAKNKLENDLSKFDAPKATPTEVGVNPNHGSQNFNPGFQSMYSNIPNQPPEMVEQQYTGSGQPSFDYHHHHPPLSGGAVYPSAPPPYHQVYPSAGGFPPQTPGRVTSEDPKVTQLQHGMQGMNRGAGYPLSAPSSHHQDYPNAGGYSSQAPGRVATEDPNVTQLQHGMQGMNIAPRFQQDHVQGVASHSQPFHHPGNGPPPPPSRGRYLGNHQNMRFTPPVQDPHGGFGGGIAYNQPTHMGGPFFHGHGTGVLYYYQMMPPQHVPAAPPPIPHQATRFSGPLREQHYPPLDQRAYSVHFEQPPPHYGIQHGSYSPGFGAGTMDEAGASGYTYPAHSHPHDKDTDNIVEGKSRSKSRHKKNKPKKVETSDSVSESESQSESDEKGKKDKKSGSTRKSKKTKGKSSSEEFSNSEPESNPKSKKADKGKGKSTKDPTKPLSRSKSKKKPKTFDVVGKPTELPKSFGRFKSLEKTTPKFKTIKRYVLNGSPCKEDGIRIKIHQIVEFGGSSQSKPSTGKGHGHSAHKAPPPSTKILLWWKTTPGSARRLGEHRNGCIAFYDVITRAYAAPPGELEGPVRQTVLLCQVSLGKMNNSTHGYQNWQNKEFPQGCDSVKGVGELTPDRKDDRDDHSTIIPCGKLVPHGKYKKYDLDYNEYMIYEARRVKVKYAVDVELIPEVDSESDKD